MPLGVLKADGAADGFGHAWEARVPRAEWDAGLRCSDTTDVWLEHGEATK